MLRHSISVLGSLHTVSSTVAGPFDLRPFHLSVTFAPPTLSSDDFPAFDLGPISDAFVVSVNFMVKSSSFLKFL